MPEYVIEREVPGAGRLSPAELKALSRKSCDVLAGLESAIQWQRSYVVDDKLYCVYTAPNAEMIREHARLGGFPANRIAEIRAHISPATAG